MAKKQLNVNPMELIAMIKQGKNPEQLVLSIFESNLSQVNPIAANLISLAKQNRTSEIEKVARNLCAQKGVDFDKEFSRFKKQYFGL